MNQQTLNSSHLSLDRNVNCVSAAVLVYRVPLTWKQKKHTWKLLHAGLMLLALLVSVLGHIPDLYSLHSWVGICTVLMFTVQVQITDMRVFNN